MKNLFEKLLQDAEIVELNRICDLIRFVFKLSNGEKLYLHATCLIRIFDSNNTLVICTQNLLNRSPKYRKKWFKRYDWTCVGATVFDDAVEDYKNNLMETKISNIIFKRDDIEITLENGMHIDVLVTTTKYDDLDYAEDYRIFDEDKNKEHFVV